MEVYDEDAVLHVHLDVQLNINVGGLLKDRIEKTLRVYSIQELVEMSFLTAYEIVRVKEVPQC